MATPAATCTVYFDGACPLCRREIAHYRRKAAGADIAWVDASSCAPGALGGDLTRSAALSRLHVRTTDGALVSGAAAFATIWSRLPGYRWLAAAASARPVLRLLEAAYSGFLRLRPIWRRVEAGGKPDHACRRNGASAVSEVRPSAVSAVDADEVRGVGSSARVAVRALLALVPPAASAASDAPSARQPLPVAVLADLHTDHAGEVGAVQVYRGVLALACDGEVRAFAARHLATELLRLQRIRRWLPAGSRSRLLLLWRAAGWLTGAVSALLGARAVLVTGAAVERFVDRHYAAQIARLAAYPQLAELSATLAACRRDGIAHRGDALARLNARPGALAGLRAAAVGRGSALAVAASRRLSANPSSARQ